MIDEHMTNEAIKEDIQMEVLNMNVKTFVRNLGDDIDGELARGGELAHVMISMAENDLDLDENTVQDFIAYLKANHNISMQRIFDAIILNEIDYRIEQKEYSWVL